jgi:hypothetical protein
MNVALISLENSRSGSSLEVVGTDGGLKERVSPATIQALVAEAVKGALLKILGGQKDPIKDSRGLICSSRTFNTPGAGYTQGAALENAVGHIHPQLESFVREVF